MDPEGPDEEIYSELARLGANVRAIRELGPSSKALGDLLRAVLKLHGMQLCTEKDSSKVETIQKRDHILAVYPDTYAKLDEAFAFLREGLRRDEAVLLMTDEMTGDEILRRMGREWNVDVADLERRGDIMVRSTKEWYFPRGEFDGQALTEKWKIFTKFTRSIGKTGLRVFGDTSPFFKYGFSKELVDYEATLEKEFDIPMTRCAPTGSTTWTR